jgi:hypothetical protein
MNQAQSSPIKLNQGELFLDSHSQRSAGSKPAAFFKRLCPATRCGLGTIRAPEEWRVRTFRLRDTFGQARVSLIVSA